jgi:regulation of enolase protein 1 (concanavalin A-like superfamily)
MLPFSPIMKRIALLLIVPLSAAFSLCAAEPVVVFEEPFHDHLRDGWTWLREEPKAWRIEDNSLVIDTLPGAMFGKEHTARNVLLRPAPVSPEKGFIIEAQITNDPQTTYEHAGIICHYDDDNWAVITKEKLPIDKTTAVPKVMFGTEQDGKPLMPFPDKPGYNDATVWVRMIVHGAKVTGLWRASEKDEWQTLGDRPFPVSTKELRVGLHSGCFHPSDGRKARWRNFRILQLAE